MWVQVWDTSSVRPSELPGAVGAGPIKLQTKAAVVAHDKDINAVAVSPDDALACTASQDRTVKVSPFPSFRSLLMSFGHALHCVSQGRADLGSNLWPSMTCP